MTTTVQAAPPPRLTREQRNRGVAHWRDRAIAANARGAAGWVQEYNRRLQLWRNTPANRREQQADGLSAKERQQRGMRDLKQRQRRVRQVLIVISIEKENFDVIHIGDTQPKEVESFWGKKPLVLMFYENQLVGYTLNHKNTRIDPHTLADYYQSLKDFCYSYRQLPPPESDSHSNCYPDRVNQSKSGMFNFSIRYGIGQWGAENAKLAVSVSSFRATFVPKTKPPSNSANNVTSASLGNTFGYSQRTQHIVRLVDKLNLLFFPEGIKRKNRVAALIERQEHEVLWRLKENGNYPLRYIASGILNPNHADTKDDHKLPSTLLYSGNFRGGDSMLTFTDYGFSIPIYPGTIISFFAWKFNHRVDIHAGFKGTFDDRFVEVFGSFEPLYHILKDRDGLVDSDNEESASRKSSKKKRIK
ncbi:hypothetical protein BDR26DRAFT_961497 [Obelidium mucronatum]|nr:hypothetical protein BDR26DRAFT_961497 [Obelidium mucronatum]